MPSPHLWVERRAIGAIQSSGSTIAAGADTLDTMGITVRLCGFALAAMVAGCATAVPRPAEVVTMGAHAPVPDSAYPAEGAIWRLDDREFKALGPLPVESVSDVANAVPGGFPIPPAGYQDYRSHGYVAPPTPVISYGAWFGFGYRSHSHRSHASHTHHPRNYSGSWRSRRR